MAANARRSVLRIRNRCQAHLARDTFARSLEYETPHTRSIYARKQGRMEILYASVRADERSCHCLNIAPDCATCDFGVRKVCSNAKLRMLPDCSRTATRTDYCTRQTYIHTELPLCASYPGLRSAHDAGVARWNSICFLAAPRQALVAGVVQRTSTGRRCRPNAALAKSPRHRCLLSIFPLYDGFSCKECGGVKS